MVPVEIKADLQTSLDAMIARLRAEMTGGVSNKPLPVDGEEFEWLCTRVGEYTKYLISPTWSITIDFDTNFEVNDVVEFVCYLNDAEEAVFNSATPMTIKTLEVEDVADTTHTLAGPIKATLTFVKTATGWNLYL